MLYNVLIFKDLAALWLCSARIFIVNYGYVEENLLPSSMLIFNLLTAEFVMLVQSVQQHTSAPRSLFWEDRYCHIIYRSVIFTNFSLIPRATSCSPGCVSEMRMILNLLVGFVNLRALFCHKQQQWKVICFSMQLSWSKESHSHDYHAQQPTQTHAQWGTWIHPDTYVVHQQTNLRVCKRANTCADAQSKSHDSLMLCVFLKKLGSCCEESNGRMDTHAHTSTNAHSKQPHSRIQQGSKSSVEAPTPFKPAVWEKNISFCNIFFCNLSPTFNTAPKDTEARSSNVDFNFFK